MLLSNYTETLQGAYDRGLELFDLDYSLTFKEAFEEEFNLRYKLEEVGFETWAEFKHAVQVILKQKSKVYEKIYTLYEAQFEKENPLLSAKAKTTQTNTATNTATGRQRFNDTPESQITTLDEGYLTSISDNTNTGSAEAETETQYEALNEQEINLLENYSRKLRNIVSDLVNEFRTCFMLILN